MRTGVANLPLHRGSAPPWLYKRMVKLGRAISQIIIDEYDVDEYLRRLADPFFFQSLACALGFDWNSSGTTTVTGAALKESLNSANLGVTIAGGKGKTSRKAPSEIENKGDLLGLSSKKIKNLQSASKLSAKVDNNLVQDGYQLYHHLFVFTEKGSWSVVQQGMSEKGWARRYHWLSDNIKSFIEEPHSAVCCDRKEKEVLNLTAKESSEARKVSVDIVKGDELRKFILPDKQTTITAFTQKIKVLTLPDHHFVKNDFRLNRETLKRAYEYQPKTYEELITLKGVGPKTIRALALIAELVYGAPVSWKDPVRYSFALGGKDGHPYRINRRHYDKTVYTLQDAINQAKLNRKEKLGAIRRLKNLYTTG